MFTLIVFIVALSLLVFVHEWGHFIAAKKAKIRVDIFSIGFGPKLIGKKWHGTEYRLAPVPFGGYVKIYGQEPYEEAEGDLELAKKIQHDPQSFASKTFLQKLVVIASGPILNLILCFVLMPVVFMVGRMEPKIMREPPVVIDVTRDSPAAQSNIKKGDLILAFNNTPVADWDHLTKQILMHPDENVVLTLKRGDAQITESVQIIKSKQSKQPMGYLGIEPMEFYQNEPAIEKVSPDSPADRAGIKAYDRVVRVNGAPIQYWTEMVDALQNVQGGTVSLVVVRNDAEIEMIVYPEFNQATKTWMLGVQKHIDPDSFAVKRYGFKEAVVKGTKEASELFSLTFEILGRLFSGHLSVKTLGGPLAIAQAASSAAKTGLGDFLYFIAFLSVQLGILNLLPIPVLDGGHVVFITVEAIRRKPISYKLKSSLTYVGMALLLGLILLITVNDVDHIWGISKLVGGMKGIF